MSPMSDETLVKVEGVSKKFCRDLKRSLWYGMKDLGNELLGRRHGGNGALRPDEFWAVNDVSFELKRGECLGLIGRNGAGKTTLLRMLNGLIKPDSGRIEMRGRVGALIALGAGFNPVLTGRENIYVNAAVLGLSKNEIDKKYEEIVNFSELKDFIDAPIQSYSSGMQVRLGFSIASVVNPDILILDEVLAVGDASFRTKCYRRIGDCKKNAAVIFVSHNMEQIARICTSGIVLEPGKPAYAGNLLESLNRYHSILSETNCDNEPTFCEVYYPIISAKPASTHSVLKQGDDYELAINVRSTCLIDGCWTRVVIFSINGGFSADLDLKAPKLRIMQGDSRLRICVTDLRLKSGDYKIGVNIFSEAGDILLWSYKQVSLEIVEQNHVGNADYQPSGSACIIYEG